MFPLVIRSADTRGTGGTTTLLKSDLTSLHVGVDLKQQVLINTDGNFLQPEA